MDSQERKWLAEEAYMNNLSCAYIQRKTKVYGINPPSNDLGYTTISKDTALIYVARLHKFMEPLSIDERSLLRLGIYTHEALHQIFTNFDETERLMRTLTGRKKALFAEAFECFKKVVPYFEKAVTEPICAKALKISMKITDIISELVPELPKEYETDRRSESASGSGKGSDATEKTDEIFQCF